MTRLGRDIRQISTLKKGSFTVDRVVNDLKGFKRNREYRVAELPMCDAAITGNTEERVALGLKRWKEEGKSHKRNKTIHAKQRGRPTEIRIKRQPDRRQA